jgi:uncharacterized membrane protein
VLSRKLSEVSAKILVANKNKYNFKIGALWILIHLGLICIVRTMVVTTASISENNFDYTKKSIIKKGEYNFKIKRFTLSTHIVCISLKCR